MSNSAFDLVKRDPSNDYHVSRPKVAAVIAFAGHLVPLHDPIYVAQREERCREPLRLELNNDVYVFVIGIIGRLV